MGRGGVTGYVLNAHIQNASSAFFSLIFCFLFFSSKVICIKARTIQL